MVPQTGLAACGGKGRVAARALWRDGKLLAVNADLQARTLFAQDDDRAVMSRILLLERGRIAFSLHGQLFLFGSTGLAPFDNGPWPCGDGNLHGTPSAHEQLVTSLTAAAPNRHTDGHLDAA